MSMFDILLLGANGQVGFELLRALQPLGNIHAPTRKECDLADEKALRSTVRSLRPDVIVNAAAFTAVDKAEVEVDAAFAINSTAPAILAEEAALTGSLLLHYSTDYVFSGKKAGFHVETDETAPLSVYGQSKLAGEEAIVSSGAKFLIFRTSWVYGLHGANFLKTILRLARERALLRVINDQYGAPTSASLIADISAQVLAQYRCNRDDFSCGIYHLVPQGETTWHGYASHAFNVAREAKMELALQKIEAITTAEYPLPASRPANSRLCTEKLRHTFGLHLPDWRDDVNRVLQLIVEAKES